MLALFGGVRKGNDDLASVPVRGDIHCLIVGDPGIGKSQLLKVWVCPGLCPSAVLSAHGDTGWCASLFLPIGIEHGPAGKVMSKLHEYSVLTFHKTLTSRKVLEREKTDKGSQITPDLP